MFQSLKYTRKIDHDNKKTFFVYQFHLTDSDFSCVVVAVAVKSAAEVVIQEYSKRNLNVAKNLFLYFRWYEKESIYHSVADQIDLAEKYSPLFTPELKKQLQKYMVLL